MFSAGEELYEEVGNEGVGDDYDQSELVNLIAHPAAGAPAQQAALLSEMRSLLLRGFPQPPP